MCFQAKEGPGDSKDPRDTEVRMGGTGKQQNELNEFAIKFQAYLSVYRTEHGSESLIFPFLLGVCPENQKLVEITAKTQTHKHDPAGTKQEGEIEEMSEYGKLAGRRLPERLWGFSQWGSAAHRVESIEMDCSVLFHWSSRGEPHEIAFL